ncbi:MAG: FAD-dependent monooxygenase [Alphaproteobacteria bacterium]|nr:FAD-dependent monooxygenase [Alphaproteobacteria bacterium]
MADPPFSLAVIGAGIGGLAAAAALRRVGIEALVFEQAQAFAPVGAGIQITANAMRALAGLGLGEPIRRASFAPQATYNREWNTGAVTNLQTMGREIEARYGAPDLMMHRQALHAALASQVPQAQTRFGKKLVGLERTASGLVLAFADGTRAAVDAVIGADGVHSKVREALFGAERLRFTGRVAYRTTYPTARLKDLEIDERAKWWGPDRHIVHYYTRPAREEIYFIAVTPEPDFAIESWSMTGDRDVLLAAFSGFHPRARAILEAAPEVRKWALADRDPLPSWGEGRVVLLGDACHPMTPTMAQGAATSIEDAVVLSRCLDGVPLDGVAAAFRRYQATRQDRTARMQLTSSQNTWMRLKTDTDWVYGYDAWTVPLASLANQHRSLDN